MAPNWPKPWQQSPVEENKVWKKKQAEKMSNNTEFVSNSTELDKNGTDFDKTHGLFNCIDDFTWAMILTLGGMLVLGIFLVLCLVKFPSYYENFTTTSTSTDQCPSKSQIW